jgi:hypothetical protein
MATSVIGTPERYLQASCLSLKPGSKIVALD